MTIYIYEIAAVSAGAIVEETQGKLRVRAQSQTHHKLLVCAPE